MRAAFLRVDERALIRDEHRYCAHPHMAVLGSGTWLLAANCAPRRAVTMHPPQDPEFINVLIRSTDEGRSWSPPVPVPGFDVTGTECAGLTALPDGGALLSQWRFRWYPYTAPPDAAREPLAKGPAALVRTLIDSAEIPLPDPGLSSQPELLMPWVRGGGELAVYRSSDDGLSWPDRTPVDTSPYSGGYGMRGAIVFPDGEILLPLCDPPFYERVFTVRSRNAGRSFEKAEPVARVSGLAFEEPAPLLLGDGTVLMLLRENISHTLYEVHSSDRGATWSQPAPTGIDCYPAHLLELPDGRIAALAGRRHEPFGISLFFSKDKGRSWDLEAPLLVRTGLPSRDLGYPTMAQRSDGWLFVAYYCRDEKGVTGIHAAEVAI